MDTVEKLISAIASLMWPLIVIVVLYRFRPALGAIIDSAKSRKFTLKIGGQELTMEEANQVQQNLIADLQNQVSEIKKNLNLPQTSTSADHANIPTLAASQVRRLLWVDDNPKNNSYFFQLLTKKRVVVDLATSTSEGWQRFNSQQYDYVISDMGRLQEGEYVHKAGIELLKLVREKNAQVPFIIFCSTRAREQYGQEALGLGATAVTSSPTELAGLLDLAD